ncbi:MAG TPA: PilZ domain-containing protein [Terriglobales bacterium]|nr:PilZ domain-containing protein [Terriglobales bacterium]
MSLQALVLCSDEKILRVLRRVLSELEIKIEHCTERDAAIRKLTRDRFEAVIVDAADQETAALVLRSARFAPCNRRAVAVAIIDGATAVRGAFELGAHFVLYKPISSERAKSSFRAARALMKRERRRNTRVAVEIPVTLRFNDGDNEQHAATVDLGEGGIAVKLPQRPSNSDSMSVHFRLPGTEHSIACIGQVAWENAGRQFGIRFVDLSPEDRTQLKTWLESRSPEFEKDDPPAACQLTDLSPGGCYLEIVAPFPVRTRVILSMRFADLKLAVEGVVRVMHPEIGMGVEFTQTSAQQREHLEKFILALTSSKSSVPELMVEPEGLETEESMAQSSDPGEIEDPLLDLFRKKADETPESFRAELRKQRGAGSAAAASV